MTVHRRLRVAVALLGAALPGRATRVDAQRIRLEARVADQSVDLGRATLPSSSGQRHPDLTRTLPWRTMAPGIELAEIDLRAGEMRIPVLAVALRIDQRFVRFALQPRTESNGMSGAWRIDSAPSDAVLAMNAGQFKETGPWGWLLVDGEERRAPLRAPLAASIGIDMAGHIRFIGTGVEHRVPGIRDGFQSFPVLVRAGRIPALVRNGNAMDLDHRDARLVLGSSRDGMVLVVLTRFAALGEMAGRVPIGLTTPETLALVLALGAEDAVMLDGGISGQLLLRDADGGVSQWRGLRSVPLGLIGRGVSPH